MDINNKRKIISPNDTFKVRFPDDPLEVINKKLDRFFLVVSSVGFVFIITLIIMVITLLIDSFHFNSATYKEYSQKTEAIDQALQINQETLDQNQKNQNTIIEQQKQIKELLEKK